MGIYGVVQLALCRILRASVYCTATNKSIIQRNSDKAYNEISISILFRCDYCDMIFKSWPG